MELLAYRTVGCCTAGIWSPEINPLKLLCMRLPQSILRHPSVRTVNFLMIAMAILVPGVVCVPAGAATPQLTCTPGHLAFGATAVGQSETLLITVANGGQSSVTIAAAVGNSAAFTMSKVSLPLVLPAGQSFDVSVTYTPTSLGWTGGTITFTSDTPVMALVLELSGDGISSDAITATPSTVSFSQVSVGSTATLPVVLTNDRTWKVTLAQIVISNSAFSMSGTPIPLTLNPGQSVTLEVSFKPQSAGTIGGSLFVEGPALSIPLTGTGGGNNDGQLTLTPAVLSFGNVPDGTTQTLPISIGASGASVTISSASSSSARFALNGASFPLTIPAGQTVSFNVAFTPTSSGNVSGAFSFASNASNSPALESLTGVGTATPYSVSLSWSPSSNVEGYNVYRSTTPAGSYSKINSTLDPSTVYTDSTVVSGQTYYYAATSVSSNGQESSQSTPPLLVVVP